jgi:hypothetical protein
VQHVQVLQACRRKCVPAKVIAVESAMLGPCGIWIEQASSSATTSVPKERASLVAWHLGGFLQRKALSHTPLERPAISISSKATAGVASSSSLGMPVEGTQLPASQQSGVSGVSYKLDVHASGQDTPSPSRQDSLSRLLAVGRSPVRAASSHSPFASPSRLRPESRWRVPRPVARSAAAPMSASLPSPSTQFSPAEEGILPVGALHLGV